jgi:uncharacterized protein YjbI with pentapeptide repeats
MNANLVHSNFNSANLSKANLRGADLSGANFHGAKFTGADLRGTNLNLALSITCEQIKSALIDGKTRLPDNIYYNFPSTSYCLLTRKYLK